MSIYLNITELWLARDLFEGKRRTIELISSSTFAILVSLWEIVLIFRSILEL